MWPVPSSALENEQLDWPRRPIPILESILREKLVSQYF